MLVEREGGTAIRPAAPGDEGGWRALWGAYCDFYEVAIPPEVTDSLWLRIMDASSAVKALVAERKAETGHGRLVGLANYVLHPFTWGTSLACYLEDLFVAEGARSQGVGTALIEALIAQAARNGWPRVYWHTHELNEAARSVYEKITPRDPFVRYVVKLK